MSVHTPYIEEWEFDEWNLAELAAHNADNDTVIAVWSEAPRYRKNTKGRPGYRMIGSDQRGAIWTIAIRPVDRQPGVWRPVTGWVLENDDDDMIWYRKRTRKGKKK